MMNKKVFNTFKVNIYTIIVALFLCLILGAILFYQPGWGLMDDFSNRTIARGYWEGERNLVDEFTNDLSRGRSRPFYMLWIFYAYAVSQPLLIHIFITLVNFLMLMVWGKMIGFLLDDDDVQKPFFEYVYPLTFFIFTPFWNNFMYISLQEKFVYIFGGLSLYFLLKAYKLRNQYYVWISFLLVHLSFQAKETSIAFFAGFIVFGLLDLFIFRISPKVSLRSLIASAGSFLYFYFYVQILSKGYSEKYESGLSVGRIFFNLFTGPVVIRSIVVISTVCIMLFCLQFLFRRKFNIKNTYILFPIMTIMYLLILAPWGFQTYLLAPLAPFVMIMLFPLVYGAIEQWPRWRVAIQGCLIFLSFLAVTQICIPNIERMANIDKVIKNMILLKEPSGSERFFYPWPYEEAAATLPRFVQSDVVYLEEGFLVDEMLGDSENFLVYDIQANSISVRNVDVGELVYANSTWKIYSLNTGGNKQYQFKPDFQLNAVQKLKNKIKSL